MPVEIAYKTEFEEFSNTLAVTFKGDEAPEDFTRDMFMAVYLPVSDDNPVEDARKRTLKSYFYGERDITALAKKIADSLDPDGFAEFVATETDSTITRLCDEYRKYYPDIDPENYKTRIADRFVKIIEKAAQAKRKRATKAEVITGITELPAATPPRAPQEKYGFYLVSEEGSTCPNDGCTHSLFTNENGHLGLLYDVVVIDPEESPDNLDNLIALCPECAARYRLGPTPIEIWRMKEIKLQFQDEAADRELLSETRIQEGVKRVVNKIPDMRLDEPPDLNYDPVMLRQKIEPDNISLYMKAKGHVNYYFNSVHEAFQQMGREGKLRFKPFCEQVRMSYLNLKEQGRNQVQIYRELTDWLQRGTNEEREYCEVVISYFIQKCEVFDVIAE